MGSRALIYIRNPSCYTIFSASRSFRQYFTNSSDVILLRAFLNDNFKTLITPSILKISKFRKKRMQKDIGTFIICKEIRKIWREKSENMEKKICNSFKAKLTYLHVEKLKMIVEKYDF